VFLLLVLNELQMIGDLILAYLIQVFE